MYLARSITVVRGTQYTALIRIRRMSLRTRARPAMIPSARSSLLNMRVPMQGSSMCSRSITRMVRRSSSAVGVAV